MLSLLVVPLDGSPFGEMALPTAARVAAAHGAAIHLMMVQDAAEAGLVAGTLPAAVQLPADGSLPVAGPAALLDRRRTEGAAYLEATAERLARRCGCRVTTGMVDGSAVSDAIAEEAARREAGLVVLTTHGRGGFSRAWLGSVAGELLRAARTPLLVVHAREDSAPSPPEDFGHVLLPVDGEDPDDRTLDAALELGRPFGARVTVLHVVRTGDSLLPYDQTFWTADERETAARRQAAAERAVAAVAARARAAGAAADGLVVLEPDPARAILRIVAERGATVVAMRAHARRGAARRFLGGTADKVIRGSPVPVLVVRPE